MYAFATRIRRLRTVAVRATASFLLISTQVKAADILPTGGQFVAGQGAISTAPGSVIVNQSSSHAIVNWQGFSVGAGNSVQFNNGTGATLNRVTGGNLSQIDGSISATGSVYLINPQGIVVGPGGSVVTNGSFIASTRDVDNDAFMSGQALHATGTSTGAVVNQGTITSQTGDVILVGQSVNNSGNISAPNGTAGLAAGEDVLLQPAGGDARIAIATGSGDVTNTGTIAAAQAELNAAGGNVYALAGNNGGIVRATGSSTVGGHVWLTAGGTTEVSGNVSANNADGSGGTAIITGGNVQVDGTANISASGTAGGIVLVGGDQQGGNDPSTKLVSQAVSDAQTTSVAPGALISADGTAGSGGNVVVWSNQNTAYAGAISARGTGAGNGGNAETSGGVLEYTGAVDLTADNGVTGTLLLDPDNLTISSSATTSGGWNGPNTVYSSPGSGSNLKNSDLVSALNSANVTVKTTNGGYIEVDNTVTATGGNNLVLDAQGKLTFGNSSDAGTSTNGSINVGSGNLTLDSGGTISEINNTKLTAAILNSAAGLQRTK